MAIEISPKSWKARIVCDVCKKPITRYGGGDGAGNVIFNMPVISGQPAAPAFVHKLTCDPRGPDGNREAFPCWQPLESFLAELDHSLKGKRRRKSS